MFVLSRPERLYIIDSDCNIVYKGGMGPFGFRMEEIYEFLMAFESRQLTNLTVET